MKMLITAIGKRVQLIKYLKTSFEIIGTDYSALAPAIHFVDKFYQIPRCDAIQYPSELMDICRKEKVDILLPLFEQELEVLDSLRGRLEDIGTFLLLSGKNVLSLCNDKWDTYKFFEANHISTPKSFMNLMDCPESFPLFIKPRVGMGSKNSIKVNNREELEFYYKRIENPIIQEFMDGIEYTMDCICDINGSPVSIVSRERLEVRAGEVSKSRTVKDKDLILATKNVCKKLKAMGPVTIQCIKAPGGDLKFTEINPRVGGGVPLSIEAGADYCSYFMNLAEGKALNLDIGNFKELTMLRYDEAVFL